LLLAWEECLILHKLSSTTIKNKDLFTLISLIAIIIVFPYFETTSIGDILLVCLFSALLISALYEVSDHPRQIAIGILLAIPTLLAAWTNVFRNVRSIWIVELITIIVFLIYILLAILKRILTAHDVTMRELYRAVNVYIMIGIAFGLIYTLIEFLTPGSFHFTYGKQTISSLLYFSFTALSTVGFGDITAVAPIARSIVVIEMIIGIMYMAVLIGLLVNAHYISRYTTRKERETAGIPDTHKLSSNKLPLLSSGGPLSLIAIAVTLNLATSILMVESHIPIFMDTWGTSLIVIIGGFWIGACAGIIYNLIMAFTIWNPFSLIWATSSILVAGSTWFFWRRGWINLKKPFKLGAAGIITGLLNTLLTMTIIVLVPTSTYEGTLVVETFFSSVAGNPAIGILIGNIVTEITDKTLSLALAAVVALFLQDYIKTS
jgi:hypothetical protein